MCASLLSLSACQTGVVRRDPKQRPTAKEALNHAWLSGGNSAERARGKPLQETVVQRIQVSKSPFDMHPLAAMASPIKWDSGSALAASLVRWQKLILCSPYAALQPGECAEAHHI